MNRPALMAMTMLATLSLAGCKVFRSNCHAPQGYEVAQNHAPIKVPAGLEAPDTRAALRIPDVSAVEAPLKANDPCLDEPPRFAPNAKSTPVPAGSATAKPKRPGFFRRGLFKWRSKPAAEAAG